MSQQTQGSSSSGKVEKLSHYDAVLTLGEKLVRELNLHRSVDTLGRWMAHYIAELIIDAEKAAPEDAYEKKQRCCDEILKFWSKRYSLPDGVRPFQNFEELEGILRKLDPASREPHYFVNLIRSKNEAIQDPEVEKWFNIIEEVDYASRRLILFCLDQAVQGAVDESKEWIALADKINSEAAPDVSLVKLFFGNDPASPKKLEADENAIWSQEIEELEALMRHAQSALDTLKESPPSVETD